MKNYFRCTWLASLMILLNQSGTLAIAQECCPAPNVYLSSPWFTVDFLFRPMWLKPTTSNLSFAVEVIPQSISAPNWISHEIKPGYQFAFELGLGVVLNQRNAMISVTWEHLYSNDSASRTVVPEHMIGPFFEIGPDAFAFKLAQGECAFKFNSFSFDYGVFVNFGNSILTNLFIGVNVVDIKQKLQARFFDELRSISRVIKSPSKFCGAGPEIGLDFSYPITAGFYLTGDAAASILVGSQKGDTSFKATSPIIEELELIAPFRQSIKTGSRTQVVPAFGGRLGLGYTFTFCKSVTVDLEIGYEARVYINAIQSIDISSEVNGTPVLPDRIGVFARTFHKTLSNFALSGPYLTLNIGF